MPDSTSPGPGRYYPCRDRHAPFRRPLVSYSSYSSYSSTVLTIRKQHYSTQVVARPRFPCFGFTLTHLSKPSGGAPLQLNVEGVKGKPCASLVPTEAAWKQRLSGRLSLHMSAPPDAGGGAAAYSRHIVSFVAVVLAPLVGVLAPLLARVILAFRLVCAAFWLPSAALPSARQLLSADASVVLQDALARPRRPSIPSTSRRVTLSHRAPPAPSAANMCSTPPSS